MNVILFGAGASYGSGPVEPGLPPMTSGLLDGLVLSAPHSWGKLPGDLRSLFRDDFERGMAAAAESRPELLAPLQRTMAQFFFAFVPGRENLYRALARRIASGGWSGSLVTLNYERLLQLSLQDAGLRPTYSEADASTGEIEVCLPHGSCHLFSSGTAAIADEVEFVGTDVATGGNPIVIDDHDEFIRRIQGDAFPPVMSYFDPAKETTSGVNIILRQRERFQKLVASAECVVVVGVAVRPEDHHLWQPLAESPGELLLCSGKSAAMEFDEWALANRGGHRSRSFPVYFSEAFDDLCEAVKL